MLRGLLGFGKEGRPPPPKGKIEVICPACGSAQYEPKLVVSTICKKCGEHLRIEGKKVVSPSRIPGASPATSSTPVTGEAANETAAEEVRTTAARAPGFAAASPPIAESIAKESRNVLQSIIGASETGPEKSEQKPEDGEPKTSFEPAAPVDAFEAGDLGFGAMLQGAGRDKPAARRPVPAPSPTPPPPPVTASTLQKMKEQGFYRQQYFKDAQCFDCNHKFKVGRSSRSTNCPQCGAYISLEDVEITMTSTQSIRTRGDVTIRKHGHLSTASLQCKDLRCYGLLEANVVCTGDAIFRAAGKIVGEVRCHRFVVEKGSDITFVNPVYADEVEIHARITGTVFCRGPVLISTYGAVNGDVTARSVSIEPGGELNGAMNIVRADSPLFAPPGKPAGTSPS